MDVALNALCMNCECSVCSGIKPTLPPPSPDPSATTIVYVQYDGHYFHQKGCVDACPLQPPGEPSLCNPLSEQENDPGLASSWTYHLGQQDFCQKTTRASWRQEYIVVLPCQVYCNDTLHTWKSFGGRTRWTDVHEFLDYLSRQDLEDPMPPPEFPRFMDKLEEDVLNRRVSGFIVMRK